MKSEWLWDSKLTERKAAQILKDPKDPRFLLVAEKLIGRLSPPKKIFQFLDKKFFCQNWFRIKKRLKQDAWMEEKVIFWQMIYESLLKELKAQGFKIRTSASSLPNETQQAVARQIRQIREQKKYTQSQLAQKLGVIQPYISRIESGRENCSVETLREVAKALGKKLTIKFT